MSADCEKCGADLDLGPNGAFVCHFCKIKDTLRELILVMNAEAIELAEEFAAARMIDVILRYHSMRHPPNDDQKFMQLWRESRGKTK